MHLVDDEDLVTAELWWDARLLHQCLDVFHTVVRGSIELEDVQRTLLVERLAALTSVTRLNGAWVQEFDESGKWTGFWILDESDPVNRPSDVPYLTVYEPWSRTYSQVLAANYNMRPAEAVFVQVNSGNQINFYNDFNVEPLTKHSVRRRGAMPLSKLYTGVMLTGNGQKDRTGVVLGDQFTSAYEVGGDLAKTCNNGKLNLYTINANNRSLAFNAMSDEDAEQPIPMGVTFPVEGTYTFAFDAEQYSINNVETVQLIDYVEQTTTDLLHGNYTFFNKAGREDKRFALIVSRAKKNEEVTTGVNPLDAESSHTGVQKIVRDGILYIIRDGKIYDVVGNQVK